MIKKSTLPTILGIIVLLAGTFFGVFLINKNQIFRLGAEGANSPKDIKVSNVTDTSLTISWITDAETLGFITWGTSESSVNGTEQDSDQKSLTHSVTLNGLKQETKYFYKINSEGTLFDNKGIPWQTSTGKDIGTSKNSLLISGSVLTSTGQPVKNALVYANVGGYFLSTLTSDSGNYVFQLGNVRSQGLNSYPSVDPSQTLVELFVQSGTGVSSAKIFPQSAKPVPPLIMGQNHDFRSLPPSKDDGVPSASLELPEDATSESKFSVPDDLTIKTTQESVTLDSVDEGETITSTSPEFFGDGPKGTTLTVKVESENPMSADVKIASNGSWSWTPPEGLAEGVHKITITWIDVDGITRSLTRNFVVQAGEAPAFEASDSGSLSETATPSPTATAKATASPTASPTQTPTAPPTPETGSLTPTLLFTILGLGVMALSFAIWKYSNA